MNIDLQLTGDREHRWRWRDGQEEGDLISIYILLLAYRVESVTTYTNALCKTDGMREEKAMPN